jgi:hypothetical protein
LSWIGPPGRKVPTGEIADAPGMPNAMTRPLMNEGSFAMAGETLVPPSVARAIAPTVITAAKHRVIPR